MVIIFKKISKVFKFHDDRPIFAEVRGYANKQASRQADKHSGFISYWNLYWTTIKLISFQPKDKYIYSKVKRTDALKNTKKLYNLLRLKSV